MDSSTASEVLQAINKGEFRLPPGSPPEMKEFFEAIRTPSNRPEIQDSMTFQHFRDFVRKQDERKTSSPSGLHYGHLKALGWDEGLL